jgi:hypothetical protein
MLAQAKKACAEALVEQSMEILDDADETREAIAKAKAQADTRQWMAAGMDRAAWRDANPQVNVQVNMPQLHLDALRARAIELKAQPQLPLLAKRMWNWCRIRRGRSGRAVGRPHESDVVLWDPNTSKTDLRRIA